MLIVTAKTESVLMFTCNIIIYLLLFLPGNLTLNTFLIIMYPCIMSLSYTVVTRHEHIIIYPYISRLTS